MNSRSRQTQPQKTSTPLATIMHLFWSRSWTRPVWVQFHSLNVKTPPVDGGRKPFCSSLPTDPTSIAKLQNIFHEYERTIQKVKSRHGYLSDKVNQLDAERVELKSSLEEVKDAKSALERNQLELQTEVTNLKYEQLLL